MQYNEKIEFEWDEAKAISNIKKHGVNFNEATGIWKDPHSLEMLDILHSVDEERWMRIGRLSSHKTLVVVFTEKLFDSKLRIISARFATKAEELQYFAR